MDIFICCSVADVGFFYIYFYRDRGGAPSRSKMETFWQGGGGG